MNRHFKIIRLKLLDFGLKYNFNFEAKELFKRGVIQKQVIRIMLAVDN